MAVVAQRVAPPQRTLTDHELVAAARRGSDQAFEELYRRYAPRIRGFVAGLVGDAGRAEDLTQEIFLNAVRRLRATETPVAFKPWVFEIARNACIDEFRRGRRDPEVTLDAEALEQATQPGATPSSEATVEARQQLADLRGAFHGLSPQHHRLLVLRELEGRSYEDIGLRLGLSRPMVESGLFRARRKLHEEYDELVSGRRCVVVQAMLDEGDDHSLRRLGVRQRRQLARHLAHCQPCRRAARDAGLSDHWLRPAAAGGIAALLPAPWLPWRVVLGAGRSAAPSPQLGALAPLADPNGPIESLGRAAAALAAILVAGAGGTFVVGHPGGRGPALPLRPVAAATSAVSTAPQAHGAITNQVRSAPPGARTRRSATARRRARARTSPSLAARPPAIPRSSPPPAGTRGAPPAMGASSGGSQPAGVVAAATGSVSAVAPAGAVLGTATGLAQAALAAAQGVGAGAPSVAHTVTATGGVVAASAGTTAAAAGSTIIHAAARK